MSRLSPFPQLALLACAAAFSAGCKTIYSDVYAPKRNYFVAPAENKIELPVDRKATPSAPAVQGLPAPDANAAPAIPGLAPVPADMGGLPLPASP